MTNKNERLFKYIDINKDTVQKLFSEYDKKVELADLQLIPEGMSTSNYIVTIKNNSKKYLLKRYPEGGGNSEREVAAYKYAGKHGINVPEIYYFDVSKKAYDRPYVIMDYINGVNLKKFIINNKRFTEEIAYSIGSNLAILHQREYESMAILDNDLNSKKALLPISDLFKFYLDGNAGAHIRSEVKDDVLEFISKDTEIVKKLEKSFVFSHGDFNSGNILVDKEEKVWFIDFEYSLSAPIYYDLGKFTRDNPDLEPYRTNVYDSFINGYNEKAKHAAPDDWLKLARLMDITTMLALINKENVPEIWSREIEESIILTMKILKNEGD